jgi:diadenosine tetraphosphate (Ap4A) HIT family hydrolase
MGYENRLIKRFDKWSVFLHSNQNYLGRVYLWANREDAIDFMEMVESGRDEEREELFQVGNKVKCSLVRLFNPDLFNYGAFGNETRHLHVHIIPRYESPRTFDGIQFDDNAWEKNYSPYDRSIIVPEETIIKIRDLIRDDL